MVRNELYPFLIILILAFASTLPSSTANIAQYDDYWAKKAAEAWNRTLETYEPMPAKVVSHLNMHTSRYECSLVIFKYYYFVHLYIIHTHLR